MAKITVTLHGQLLSELNLQPGQEYIAGRSGSAHIQLTTERGISRQHVKFYQDGDKWFAQLVSKYGGMIHNGQSVDQVELDPGAQFSIPPYHFAFTEEAAAPPVPQPVVEESKELSVVMDHNFSAMSDDITASGISTLIAYLKIKNENEKTEEVFKLEGDRWVIGRQDTCEVAIHDSAVSRKHFVLTKNSDGYFITDNGSSNGTFLNGHKLPENQAVRVTSGDSIVIRHIEITFEIHDLSYQNKLMAIPVDDPAEGVLHEHDNHANNYPPVLKIPAPTGLGGMLKNRPKPVQIIIGLLVLVLIYGLWPSSKAPMPTVPGQADSASNNNPQTLTPDKKKEVADIYNLAHNYYIQKKYVLCNAQIEKLHSIVPFYEDSKSIESVCKQAQEIVQINNDRQRKEEERTEVENKIRQTVQSCKDLINADTTIEALNACLQTAIELDPQNGQITDLQNQVQMQQNAKNDKAALAAEHARRRQEGQILYNKATAHFKAGQLKESLKEFSQFVNGHYPTSQEDTAAAERNISSIKGTLDAELNKQVAICQNALSKSDMRGAILACNQVLKEHPDNQAAMISKAKAISQLNRIMKGIYEDSILEESIGNIDAAKEKWSKILDSSVPDNEYYKKAQSKLRKYGIGL